MTKRGQELGHPGSAFPAGTFSAKLFTSALVSAAQGSRWRQFQ